MKRLVQVGTGLLVILLLLAVLETIEQDSADALKNKWRILFQFDNPEHQMVLNTPSKPVRKLPDKRIDALIDAMQKFITIDVGGISANQVGEPLQVFLLAAPAALDRSIPAEVFINPVITHVSDEKVCFWHGCLSAKDQPFGKTATWKEVTIQAQDASGNTFTRELKGLDAIVAQHEFRHLLGGGYHEHANEFYEEMTLTQRIFQKKERLLEACGDDAPFLLSDYQPGERIEEYARRTRH